MSKLFDTLEQIRRNESYHVSVGTHKKLPEGTRKQGIYKTLLIVMVLTGFTAVFVSQLKFTGKTRKSAAPNYSTKSVDMAPSPSIAFPPDHPRYANLDGEDIISLNKAAITFVENHDHWRGIFIFSNMLTRNPDSIEAMINISVALAELGLAEPAKRYLRQALTLDRKHPDLQKNITILKNEGIISKDFPEPVRNKRS